MTQCPEKVFFGHVDCKHFGVSDACRTGAANDWRLEAETRPDDAAKAAEELPFWKRHSLFADSVSDEPYDKA